MSTINNVQNSSPWNIQGNYQVSGTQGAQEQPKIHHHHHHKSDSQDSVELSNDIKDTSTNGSQSPLSSLVTNGTITQDQENSIKSAFLSARQANPSGAYGSKPTNPLNELVTNGTITQSQADSITNAFKSKVQANGETQGNNAVHHHQAQQTQDASSVLQTPQTSTPPLGITTDNSSASDNNSTSDNDSTTDNNSTTKNPLDNISTLETSLDANSILQSSLDNNSILNNILNNPDSQDPLLDSDQDSNTI